MFFFFFFFAFVFVLFCFLGGVGAFYFLSFLLFSSSFLIFVSLILLVGWDKFLMWFINLFTYFILFVLVLVLLLFFYHLVVGFFSGFFCLFGVLGLLFFRGGGLKFYFGCVVSFIIIILCLFLFVCTFDDTFFLYSCLVLLRRRQIPTATLLFVAFCYCPRNIVLQRGDEMLVRLSKHEVLQLPASTNNNHSLSLIRCSANI